jgi:hypothetical protein
MVHGIRAILDAQLDWVVFHVDIVNFFNTVSHKAIIKELRTWGGNYPNFSICLFFLWFLCILVIIIFQGPC